MAQRHAGEADDLEVQLPKYLKADLMPPTAEAQPFGVDESAEGAARQASVDEAAAR